MILVITFLIEKNQKANFNGNQPNIKLKENYKKKFLQVPTQVFRLSIP